jgi:hypothetical protein
MRAAYMPPGSQHDLGTAPSADDRSLTNCHRVSTTEPIVISRICMEATFALAMHGVHDRVEFRKRNTGQM